MKKKLLDTKSIEASLMEHADKLLRWHNQPKIDRSTVLKAASEYEKQNNFIPFEERASSEMGTQCTKKVFGWCGLCGLRFGTSHSLQASSYSGSFISKHVRKDAGKSLFSREICGSFGGNAEFGGNAISNHETNLMPPGARHGEHAPLGFGVCALPQKMPQGPVLWTERSPAHLLLCDAPRPAF